MSLDLDQQRTRDQRILEHARAYRETYRLWRKLDRERSTSGARIEERIDAQQACAAAERALLACARGE